MNTVFVDNPVNKGSSCERKTMRPSLIALLRIAILVCAAGAICAPASARGGVATTAMFIIAYALTAVLVWAWAISRTDKTLLMMPAIAVTGTAVVWIAIMAMDLVSGGASQSRWVYTLLMCLPMIFLAIVVPSSPTCDNKG